MALTFTFTLDSADNESILFELIKISTTTTNDDDWGSQSEIRRIPLGAAMMSAVAANQIEIGQCKANTAHQSFTISSPLEFASNVANFDSDGNFILYLMAEKFGKRNKQILENVAVDMGRKKNKTNDEKISILEMRRYLREKLATNVYKSNSLGQILYPLVETTENGIGIGNVMKAWTP